MLPKLLGLVLGLILAPGARAACAFTNCDGAYTCDYWSYGWTCAALEADYGCDCTDCACGETVETAVSTEADIHAALADHSIDIVTIEEGTYALSKTLQINRPVTVQAAPGATVLETSRASTTFGAQWWSAAQHSAQGSPRRR